MRGRDIPGAAWSEIFISSLGRHLGERGMAVDAAPMRVSGAPMAALSPLIASHGSYGRAGVYVQSSGTLSRPLMDIFFFSFLFELVDVDIFFLCGN